MRRLLVSVVATVGITVAAAGPAQASPMAAKLFNQAASRIAGSPSIHAEVSLPSQQRIVVDHVAGGGQLVQRFLGGQPLRTDALLWSGTLIAGQAPTLTGVFELRAGQPCWKVLGFSAPYRMETTPFGALQTDEERARMAAPRLTRRQVKTAKRSPAGVIRLKARRGAVTATMDVSAANGQPVRLQVDQSQMTVRFAFPARWEPAVPSPAC